jgi:hypothetical protein
MSADLAATEDIDEFNANIKPCELNGGLHFIKSVVQMGSGREMRS